MSRLFTSGGQGTGPSASASVLPMNILGWFPLGWTGWISLQSRGLSRVFSKNIKSSFKNFGQIWPERKASFGHNVKQKKQPWAHFGPCLGKMLGLSVSDGLPCCWKGTQLRFTTRMLTGPAGWHTVSLSLFGPSLDCPWAGRRTRELWGETAAFRDGPVTGDTGPPIRRLTEVRGAAASGVSLLATAQSLGGNKSLCSCLVVQHVTCGQRRGARTLEWRQKIILQVMSTLSFDLIPRTRIRSFGVL